MGFAPDQIRIFQSFYPVTNAIVWYFDIRISNLFEFGFLELEILKAIIGCRSGSG
jgi:hypothetical protein